MGKNISKLSQYVGAAVSVLASVKAASEMVDVFQKAMVELEKTDAEIDAEMKTTLKKVIEACHESAVEYLKACEDVKRDWNSVQSLVGKKESKFAALVEEMEKLLKALGEVKKSHSDLADKLRSTMAMVVNMETRCKGSYAECRSSKQKTILIGVALAALIVGTAPEMPPVALSGPTVAYAIYSRYNWLEEIGKKLEKHLTDLAEMVQDLKVKTGELRTNQLEMDELSKAVEASKKEIEKTKTEHERAIAMVLVLKF